MYVRPDMPLNNSTSQLRSISFLCLEKRFEVETSFVAFFHFKITTSSQSLSRLLMCRFISSQNQSFQMRNSAMTFLTRKKIVSNKNNDVKNIESAVEHSDQLQNIFSYTLSRSCLQHLQSFVIVFVSPRHDWLGVVAA